MGLRGYYFAKTDQRETAEQYNEILQEMAPNFPMAKRLNRELHPGIFTRLLRRMAGDQTRRIDDKGETKEMNETDES